MTGNRRRTGHNLCRAGCKAVIESTAIMKLREKLRPEMYEKKLQELRRERHDEAKRVKLLVAILAKKVGSETSKNLPDRAA
jgi:hypothetical protein